MGKEVINIGDIAPDFTLPATGGNDVTLSTLKGKNVVLYFYPKDNTPGCTQESKDFRDLNQQFDTANTIVFGLSKDSLKSHDKFKTKYDFQFQLLADEEGKVLDLYQVWKEKSMYGKTFMGIERTTILVNTDGKIGNIWRKVKVKGHAQEVLDAVNENR